MQVATDLRSGLVRDDIAMDEHEALREEAGSRQDRCMQAALERALQFIEEGVLVVDAESRIRKINDQARRLLGLSLEDLEGRAIGEVAQCLPASEREALLQATASPRAFGDAECKTPERWRKEIRSGGPASARIEVASYPIPSEGEPVLGRLFVMRSVGDKPGGERAAGDIVALMSHELRTPLTAAAGFAALLASRRLGELTPSQAHAVRRIQRQCARLLARINDVLDTAQMEWGELRLSLGRVGSAELLNECVNRNRPLAEAKQVRLALALDDDLPALQADPARLRRVLDILIENAIDFSPRGDTVRIAARNESGQLVIEVRDRGPSVPASAQEHVFEKFAQVLPHGKKTRGSGVGLYLAANLVRMHGGQIRLERPPDRGCAFVVSLPAVEE